MVLRRFLVATVVVVIVALAAINIRSALTGKATDLAPLSDADVKSVTVHLERERCYGNCPIYSLTIHGDGRVEYNGKEHVKLKGAQEGRIEPATIKSLMSEFEGTRYLSLTEDYSREKCDCRECTDMATVITQLTARGMTHKVNHYYGCACAPEALFKLESAIDKAANSEQWTGDVSNHGPSSTTCGGL